MTILPPSPSGASSVICKGAIHDLLGAWVDDAISERIAFLREQIGPDNDPRVNETLQHQVAILETADLQQLDRSIVMRKAHLQKNAGPHGNGAAVL